MSNIKKVKSSLDSFLVDKTPVLVLKGAWGVGKTYFWNEYIKENISNKRANQIAYSYVSLFGLNSLEQLKTKIFENGKPIKSKEEVEKEFQQSAENMSSLYQYVPWLKDFWQTIKFKSPWLGRLTKHGKELPWINKVAPLISAVEYGLVKKLFNMF